MVAMVCDDSSLQPVLPQVIVGNHNILRVAYLKELEPMLPENIIVVRAKSSWITTELLIVVMEQLRRGLDNRVVKTPVLLMDACPVHLDAQVWKAARRLHILLCFVPASLTWLLQPLDVKILMKLKAFVRSEYRKLQIQMASALVHACLHVCMYACLHVCMSACMHVCMYACMNVCMCTSMHVGMYACMHVCMYACMHERMCVHVGMYACRHVGMYACMHVCIYACMHERMCVHVGM